MTSHLHKAQNVGAWHIYKPNKDKPAVYKKNLKQKIDEFDNKNGIICDDWNLEIDPNVDTENYKTINNPNARSVVSAFF